MKKSVVTGLGTVNPLGHNVDQFWQACREGKSGIAPITRFDTEIFTSKYAAEVKEWNAGDYMDGKEARKMDRFSQYVLAGALEAWKDAGLDAGGVDPSRVAVIMGVGIGGFETTEAAYKPLFIKNSVRVPPMTIPKMIINIGPANIAIYLGLTGPALSVSTACSSATDAITLSKQFIESGAADVVLTGGVEAPITRLGVAGFNVIQALSTKWVDEPHRASRPFDRDRDGFVIAEGAGVLVIESEEHAAKRGKKPYAELAGGAMTNDANHLTAPHPEGVGAIACFQRALENAGIAPDEVDYVNAHGTSTPLNDPTETMVIKKVFGDHAYKLKISSTKSMTGHLVGAAGAVEAIASILAIRDQWVPPTINLDNPDEACDLDYVPNAGVDHPVNVAVSDSLGFGGHNGVAIFRKIS